MKEVKVVLRWDANNFLNLKVGATYTNEDLNKIKEFEYKTPEHWNINDILNTAKHNIVTDLCRLKNSFKKFILKELKPIYENNKKLCVASFIATMSVPLTASILASKVNQPNSQTIISKSDVEKAEVVNLGLNDDIISKIFEKEDGLNKPVIIPKDLQGLPLDEDGIPIKKNTVVKKHKVGDVVEIYYLPKKKKEKKVILDDNKFWNTVANDIKSGTFVGSFKNSKFKVSKEEQNKRIIKVYNYFKTKEEDFKINALVATAQFILESNSGQSNLANLGCNLFGLKEFRKDFPYLRADDDGNDLDETGKSRFRKYYDIESGLLGYCEFISKSLYDNVRANYKDTDKYIYNLQHLYWNVKKKEWCRYADNDSYEYNLKAKVKEIKKLINQ